MVSFGIIMEPNAKKRWVEALRSGKYPQGENYLARINEDGSLQGLCCLGVQAMIEGVPSRPNEPSSVIGIVKPSHLVFNFGNGKDSPTYPTPEWFANHLELVRGGEVGISATSREQSAKGFYAENIMNHLAEMNDKLVPFIQIADWIEANL